jgi:ribonuclease HII
VWKGDRVAACIAAASVVAKVTRDRLMVALHDTYPRYGFPTHKGYCTEAHQAALREHGPCPEHRYSYVNVRTTAGLGDAVAGMGAIIDDTLMDDNGPIVAELGESA